MPAVAYTVRIVLPSDEVRRECVAWLTGGHVQAVLAGGAGHARVVQLDEPLSPPTIEVRYQFPDGATLARYLREIAPALREDGLRAFGSERGVTMSRTTGTILWDSGGVPSA